MGIVHRWYDILNLLLARDKLSVGELEERLNITVYTIKSNIKLLNNELVGIAQIEEQDNDYYLNIQDFDKLDQIMSGSFKKESDFNSSSKRIAYILKTLIMNKDFHIITDLAEDLMVSRNTVNNDLKSARQLIAKYNVSIESATGRGIRLVGSPLDKRMVYVNLVQDYFSYQFVSEEVIKNVLDILSNYSVTKETTNLVIKAIDVTRGAIAAGSDMDALIPYYTNTAEDTDVYIEVINYFESYYEMSLSQFELNFLSFPFNITNLNYNNEYIRKNIHYLPELYDHVVNRIQESFVVEIKKDYLYSKMSNHLFYLINRAMFYIAPKEMFFGEVEKKYPFSYQIAKLSAEAIGEKIDRVLHSIEIDYLTLYFEMAFHNRSSKKQIDVAIISNSGQGTATLIRKQIDSVIGEGTSFTRFTEESYREADLSDFFVIFTTIPIQNPPKGIPVIRISNILSEQWLSKELERVISTNPNLIQSTLQKVYHLDHEKDYHTNLNDMMLDMKKEGLIDDEFIERIDKREKKQLTIFNNGVAFPHEVNFIQEDIILTIGLLDNGYEVDNQEVKLIFLLAVPEKLTLIIEENLLELYDLIFRLAGDPNFKKDLEDITEESEFIKYLENRRLS